MRTYSRLAIVFSHDSPDEVETGTTVQLTNGASTVEVSDFQTALSLLPPGSEVLVVAKGTVGDKTVHRISRVIAESAVLVALDLTDVTECSRVYNSPFKGNLHLSSISFPSNLVSINPRAFAGCTALHSVRIPETCVTVGAEAFADCQSLQHLEFKDASGWMCGQESAGDLTHPEENPMKFISAHSPFRATVLTK